MGSAANKQSRKQAHILDFEEARSASRAAHAQRSRRDGYPIASFEEDLNRSSDGYRGAQQQRGARRGAARTGSHARSARDMRGDARGRAAEEARGRTRERARLSDDDLRRSARTALEARMHAVDEDSDDRYASRGTRRRSGVSDRMERRSNDARKRRADRMFDRQIGDDAPAAEAGPRAAVYRGKMGHSHRRSARMQNERAGTDTSLRGRIDARLSSVRRPAFAVPVVAFAFVLVACGFLYPSAKEYYTAVRDEAKASAQLAVLQQRNDDLQQRVDELSSDAGVESEARSDYGWVKDGENAVRVSGLSDDDQQTDPSAASASNVEAPDTWYSGVLDRVFGYDNQ